MNVSFRARLRALLFVAMLGASLLPTVASAQPSSRPPSAQGGRPMVDPLGLSPAQRAKMRPIIAQTMQQMQALYANEKLTPAQRDSRVKALGVRSNARVMAILTPAQRKKAMQLRAQYMARARANAPKPYRAR